MDRIWEERKRHLGFPISFTKYYIANGILYTQTGLLSRKISQVRLYKILDIDTRASFIDLICRQGTLVITSNDKSTPTLVIENIQNYESFLDFLNNTVEAERLKAGMRTREIVSEDINY